LKFNAKNRDCHLWRLTVGEALTEISVFGGERVKQLLPIE
jgi:hypothetical protein